MAPFKTFWQAGYEGADHRNRLGESLSMNEATGHIERVREDYKALKSFNISTVRESVGWRLVEGSKGYDFSSVAARMEAANETGIQICWTVCHYGWPEDIDIFAADFVPRFARLCGALARFLVPFYVEPPVYSPVNEISFTSWGISVGLFPCSELPSEQSGEESKRQLVRASIAASEAIWSSDPRARILHCDPIIHMVPPDNSPEWRQNVLNWHNAQFQSWDMLSGKLEPELGGAPRYLDLIGANYYHDNQWESGSNQRLWWHLGDNRRRPLHEMLLELYHRYQRPILLAETSHVGSGRGAWIGQIAADVAQAQIAGVDVLGICLYPAIDRPDWEDASVWNCSGLWDLDRKGPDPLARKLDSAYAAALLRAQHILDLFQTRFCKPTYAEESTYIMKNLYVFSHLRWDFVFQRPQHLLTRLAQHYRIVFIEEPVFDPQPAGLSITQPAPNITVVRPHTPSQEAGFHDGQIAHLHPLIAELIAENDAPIVWFYTPMALPLLSAFNPSLVVYDCMDELAAFEKAPRQLLQRESALLARADLLFTGGPSLYAAKVGRHHNIHCFPSSVDAIHFEQALDRTNDHPLQQALAHPRLGYCGVIDERMDLDLLAALADAHPHWQVVMVGPVVKIDHALLPKRANIHYFGMQPYQALPQFLAGWDVCLMPFALNASTRFISPTKVLEYMAARLPIVSTAITDVVKPYGHVVAIGHDHVGFIGACEDALAMSSAARQEQHYQMKAVVDATSWDTTAKKMHSLVEKALTLCALQNAMTTPAVEAPYQGSQKKPMLRLMPPHSKSVLSAQCLILGAGPTGLSAAYHYGSDAVLLERNETVGGWCRSIEDQGFTFDYAGHIMFSNDPYVLELYDMLLGENIHWQAREAWIYTDGIFTRYPFQGALYGLPPIVIKECILGAIEARYGLMAITGNLPQSPRAKGEVRNSHRVSNDIMPDKSISNDGKARTDCCADGSVPDSPEQQLGLTENQPDNFEHFIYQTWGAGIAKHFAIPYNKKLWTIPLTDMETSWLGGRVPLPDLAQIIEGALEPTGKPMGPNARFGYPLQGGFQALMSGFLPHIEGTVETQAEVIQLLPREHIAVLADGRQYRYEQMISTMPLPELIRLMGDDVPAEVRGAANGLRHISVRCVNLGIGRANLTDKHWIYYPGSTIFHRIFVQGNTSPACNPPGGCGLTCEISYSPMKPLPVDGQELIDRCIAECISVGIFTAEDPIITSNQIDIPYAYVVYDHSRTENVEIVRQWLLRQDILLSGRYSEWEYYNSDHAFLAGKSAAEKVKYRLLRQGSGA
ncbi:NAD(P)-binding protein [Edaphovirga cremea]|uniref:NAD(P)-binding protein n=1 Tax=Edaphovirga cremea TaxID=2267246 RepID=UPI00398A4C92